jgi:hypothetical protein
MLHENENVAAVTVTVARVCLYNKYKFKKNLFHISPLYIYIYFDIRPTRASRAT